MFGIDGRVLSKARSIIRVSVKLRNGNVNTVYFDSTLFTRPGEILESLAKGMFTTNERAIATVGLCKNILCNGNRTEWGQIRSAVIRVVTKSDDLAAVLYLFTSHF